MRLGLGHGMDRGGFKKPFEVADPGNLELWLDATDTDTLNAKMAAEFTTGNNESLSSASSDFDKGDEDFSISFWFYATSPSLLRGLMEKGSGASRSYDIWHNTGNLSFTVDDGTVTTTVQSGVTLVGSTWHFATAVHDSVNDEIRISVDGENFVTAAHSGGAYTDSADDFRLGVYNGTNYHNGRIDSASFYNKALTHAEVQALYNSDNGYQYSDLSTTTSIVKNAAEFTTANTEYLENTSTDFQKNSESFSVGGWFYRNSTAPTEAFIGIWSQNYVLQALGNTLYWSVNENGTPVQPTISSAFTANTWHFIVGVYDHDNSLAKVSIDGGAFTSLACTDIRHDGGDFRIGAQQSSRYFDGRADNCFFYDKALNLAEVQALYNSGNGVEYTAVTNTINNTLVPIAAKFTAADLDRLEVNSADLRFGSGESFSVFGWVKTTDTGGGIVSLWNASGNYSWTMEVGLAGDLDFIYSTTGSDFFTISSGTTINDGAWHSVMIQYDSSDDSYGYAVDGETINTGTTVSPIHLSTNNSFHIGRDNLYGNLTGDITQVCYYSKMISQAQLNALHNSGAGIAYADADTVSLVAWWDLSELSGTREDSHGTYDLTDVNTVEAAPGLVDNYTITAIDTSLVSWWNLNEASGNRADSHGSNTLTDNNTVTSSAGKVGTTTSDMVTDLVSWWELNEQSGTRFDEHGGNNLADNNTVTYNLGKVQEDLGTTYTSADFIEASTQYLESASTDFDKGNESFSVGCWFYLDDVASQKVIMSKWESASGELSYLLRANNTTLDVKISGDGSSETVKSHSATLSATTWYFAVFVYDADTDLLKVSLNGETFETTSHTTGAYSGSALDFRVGSMNNGTQFMNGVARNCFFYDKALSLAEIGDIYDLGTFTNYSETTAAMKTSLVSWWNLDEASGTRVDSVTASGNDLTDGNTVGSSEITAGYVWRWTDKSDNVYNFDQNTAASQMQYLSSGFGTNSVAHVLGDGVDDSISATISSITECTTFIAFRHIDTTTLGDTLMAGINGAETNAKRLWFDPASETTTMQIRNEGSTTPIVSITQGNDYVVAVRWKNGTEIEISINGGAWTAKTVDGNDAITGIALGDWYAADGARSLNVEIAEFICYSSILSDGDAADVESYLNAKYGIY